MHDAATTITTTTSGFYLTTLSVAQELLTTG
jgi:hypothetical protein